MGTKRQGWYLYEKQAFAIMDPDQVKAVCEKCNEHNTTVLRHEVTNAKAFGCLTCGHVTREHSAALRLVPLK